MNEVFGWKPEKIPSRNSIENRVKKSGYGIYKEPAYAGAEEEHAQTTDESMMPGSEKMLLSWGVRAERQFDVPLNMSDVKVLESNHVHIHDIGHTTALPVEKLYGDDRHFKAYTKAVAGVKVREVMRETGYLLPPRQRTIARFMNLSQTIKRSKTCSGFLLPRAQTGSRPLILSIRTVKQQVN
ncbi:hypothetical protein Barb4_03513 [Bacteroidales bacterium Barb4]|nr:hypothetical protein Barb4_03513 [Bacteroidales bacterium Barb4]